MHNQTDFKYFAFISYNSHDMEWGKRIQRKLEGYRMPSTLCSQHGWSRNPIKPIFFAPTDIQPGGLTEELQERLKASRNLIVICSPHSAQSEWVGKEIEFFHQLGRTKHIHFFIVEGVPHSGNKTTECFNPVIDKLGIPEILGANIHERIFRWRWLNKERAYVQLISKLLGVEFDSIWQRHKRILVQRILAYVIGIICVLSMVTGAWIMNRPVDVEMQLQVASVSNKHLPPLKDAVVTLSMENEMKCDTVRTESDHVTFANIPHRFLGKEVNIQVACRYFIPIDTTVLLASNHTMMIARDPIPFGKIHFRLWNPHSEQAAAHTAIQIDGKNFISDENGFVSTFIPLEEQKKAYPLVTDYALFCDTLYMPCGTNASVTLK